jgi:tRNA A-37 threonylcarbamoyl transferase component Bud32
VNVPVTDPVSAIAHRIAAERSRTHRVRADGGWWHFDPVGSAPLAQQGWKVHVSTEPCTAAETLRRVAPLLLGRGVRWKSARSAAHLANLASPPSPVSQAGKFITVYPDPDDVATLAGELHTATADLTGPVITSDRRYARGSNVYLRYGAFTGKVSYAGAEQVRTLVIHSPDGEPVLDSRGPGAARPDWADDPLPPLPPRPRPGGHGLFGRGTRITAVLRSSVRGGVFRGEHDGRAVVVKEGRAGTVPDLLGRDSVDRLRNEWRLLRRLSGTSLAPEPVDFFVEEGNAYLIVEFLPGMTLRKRVNQDNYRGGAEPAALRARCRAVTELAAGLRAHGVELRDFTPNNIMVDGDRLTAIDLELYSLIDSPEPPFAGWTPGYGAAGQVDSDFGVAATVHFVLTGVDPYVGSGHDAGPHIPALLAAFAPDLPDERAFVLRHLAPAATAVDTVAESALADAVATGDELVERTEWDRGPWPWPRGWATDTYHPACFHTGAAGVAHFYLDLFQATGERRWAEHAGDLLSRIAADTPVAPGSTPLGLHFGIGSLPWGGGAAARRDRRRCCGAARRAAARPGDRARPHPRRARPRGVGHHPRLGGPRHGAARHLAGHRRPRRQPACARRRRPARQRRPDARRSSGVATRQRRPR